MRGALFLVIVLTALVTTLLAIFGDESYPRLLSLRNAVELQNEKNARLATQVQELRKRASLLQRSDGYLEKVARNELSVARPDELVVFFEEREAPR